jgi:two-component system alkaline phosphatase synthesis response regulator PhoP
VGVSVKGKAVGNVMKPTILVVDDDLILAETIGYALELAEYQVILAPDGKSAIDAARHQTPDLIILDVILPGMDGLEVCRQFRREKKTATTPIMMLTGKNEEMDRVVGLEVGADDYLSKPFGRRELLARVQALLRRAGYALAPSSSSVPSTPEGRVVRRELRAGPLAIDLAGRQVSCRGRMIEMQPKQFDLLVCLIRHRGVVLTRSQLLRDVWGYEYAGDTRTVDVHIRWLREKIEEDPPNPKLIQTVFGVGYVFRG